MLFLCHPSHKSVFVRIIYISVYICIYVCIYVCIMYIYVYIYFVHLYICILQYIIDLKTDTLIYFQYILNQVNMYLLFFIVLFCGNQILTYLLTSEIQKQPFRGVLRKKCSENMQQIYNRTSMLKCDFNKVANLWTTASERCAHETKRN